MPDWTLPTRKLRRFTFLAETLHRSEVADDAGAVIVETRRLHADRHETTIVPSTAPDPDGPQATVFATTDSELEAFIAHKQAVLFVTNALTSTSRAEDGTVWETDLSPDHRTHDHR